MNILEARIREKLAPYLLDGTEAIEKILLVLRSPSRPSDLRRAIAKILRGVYRDTVAIDVVVDVLLNSHEAELEEGP